MNQRIEDYGVIGDLRTMALVGRDGSIDWLCLPRFDSGACFARLLGDDEAGFWRIAPAGAPTCTRRRYRDGTLILETEWDTPEGAVRVVDLMPVRDKATDVVRVVEGLRGRVPMRMELRLRFDYGHIIPWVRRHGQLLSAVAGPDAVWLDTPVEVKGEHFATVAEFEVSAGETVPFTLTHHPSHEQPPARREATVKIAETQRFWDNWISQGTYEGPWKDAVTRSSVILKALTYAPTGGIVAAATTSLPEQLGGVRNWDYRYCWLRDATFTLQALLNTGYDKEAVAWRDWLLRAVAGDPADLQIMYAIDGTRRIPEFEVDWLAGYERSRPVRIGNAAVSQLQLDVWGEVLDGLHVARSSDRFGVDESWGLQRALLDHLEGHWREPDNSLWEVRGPRRQFVYSKVMAWAGIDRAVQAVERFGLSGPVQQWRALRAEIHQEVCTHGFDAERATFTQFYGSRGLDAALLLIPRVGFLPWNDPRVTGTVTAVEHSLMEDGFVLRYRPEADGGVDGLPGQEGAFLACSFWLADALHGTGRTRQARELFERLLNLRNDLGILSEEYDPVTGRQLGNTPQAFSHVGLVNSALHLSGFLPGRGLSTDQ
ncbi:glycoside hydrolase family 15 protein [Corynebacterium sp. YIM 101645]|uniref:Glycoside hydrolase family 15 protein n=1 Tax=Corynebacterium lemuris TaxID=1859292 RepID=A0ABT2G010_9CORY|nr:glycoside hydrolase family 15 protein [Corynebacterium lemuris]MCS5480838.1 glycoside hydrolase family 15 protein [Corynebacterium lemuris]